MIDDEALGSGTFRGHNNQNGDGVGIGGKNQDPLSYVEKSALSMVLFLREICISSINEIKYQMNLINDIECNILHDNQIQNQNQNVPQKLNDANFSGKRKENSSYQPNFETPVSLLQSERTPGLTSTSPKGNNNKFHHGEYNARNLEGEFELGKNITGANYKEMNNEEEKEKEKGKGPQYVDTKESKILNQRNNNNNNNDNDNDNDNDNNMKQKNQKEVINVQKLSSAHIALKAAVSMASQPSLRRLMIAGGEGKIFMYFSVFLVFLYFPVFPVFLFFLGVSVFIHLFLPLYYFLFCLVLSCLVLSCLVLSCLALSCLSPVTLQPTYLNFLLQAYPAHTFMA